MFEVSILGLVDVKRKVANAHRLPLLLQSFNPWFSGC